MAELGSKGVTAGKIASNVQKKLTRAQEKVKRGRLGDGGGMGWVIWDSRSPSLSSSPTPCRQPGGGILCWPPRGAWVSKW